jgi:hypothetical protein
MCKFSQTGNLHSTYVHKHLNNSSSNFPHSSLLRRLDSLRPILATLLHSLTLQQSLTPLPTFRIALLPLLRKALAHNLRWRQQKPMPRDESQIRVRAFIADQIRFAGLLEMCINHPKHPADLIAIAIETGRQILLRMVEDEPGPLAKVWSLDFISIHLPLALIKYYVTYPAHSSENAANTWSQTSPATWYSSTYSPYRTSRADTR